MTVNQTDSHDGGRTPQAAGGSARGSGTARRVKVLHVISDLSLGGTEIMLYKLLSAIDRESFDPIVVSLIDRGKLHDRIEELNIPVHTARMSAPLPTPASVWRFLGLVRELKPDLIHGWMYHGSLAAQLARTLCATRTPVIWGIHNSINSLTKEKRTTAAIMRLCAFLSQLPDSVIFVSQSNRAQHVELGFSNNQSCIIPNGFDPSLFMPSPDARSAVRAELGLTEDCILIGLVGRFHPVKGHANFLSAASLLAAEHPDVRFVLCGTGVDWDNTELRELVLGLGLEGRVHLLGERQDMPRLITALDIMASSSKSEAFPNVVGEAMLCGVPCAITNVGDVPWIIGDTGRVAPPSSPRAFAEAWKELIAIGPEARRELGRVARRRVIEHFSLNHVTAQYESLYRSLAGVGQVEGHEPAFGQEGRRECVTTARS